METFYDWASMIVFAGLITLFLQRSAMDEPPDSVKDYFPPAVGCALANYLGNEGYGIPAIAVLLAVGFYVYKFLHVRFPGQG